MKLCKKQGKNVDYFRACFSNWSFVSRTSYDRRSLHIIAQVAQNSMIAQQHDCTAVLFFSSLSSLSASSLLPSPPLPYPFVPSSRERDHLFVLPSPVSYRVFITFPIRFRFFSHFALFVVNVVLTWLFSFFFGFVVALVLCVKPAPEQQRLDDAIGFLRDHAEVRIAEFQFFSLPLFIRSFFLRCWLFRSFSTFPSSPFLFVFTHVSMPRPSRNSYARTRSLHLLLITLSVNRWLYIVMKSSHYTQFIIMAWIFH